MSRLKNHQGFSLVELLVAAGLAAFVIGISAVPIIQMKKLENKVEFLSSLDIAHQIALQRARSGRFLKENLGATAASPLTPASHADKCFGGRGVGCNTLIKNNAVIGRFPFTKEGAYSATSVITATVTCPNDTKCTSVSLTVTTSQDAGTHNSIAANWVPVPLTASFVVPAAALSSRQEIDFAHCAGKVITGINYETLKAECTAVTGMNTCANQASTGPMTTFGGAEVATNCQPPISKTCATGLKTVGMIDNQAICAPAEPECIDPLSTNCPTTVTLPPCGSPNWQPHVDDKCLNETFTQYDMRSPACALAPRAAVGRNVNRCAPDSCTLTGTVKWPDATLGPCEATAVNMTTPVGSNASVTNSKPGFQGAFSATCRSNMPAPSTFNIAGATTSCSAIVCSGVANNANVNWSSTGLQSATPGVGMDTTGPTWPCGGNLTVTQTPIFGVPAPVAGQLYAEEAQSSARAFAANTAATATSGGITVSCMDPGPVGSPRSGRLKATGISCALPTPPANNEPFCTYTCIDNFVQTIDGRLEPGETSPETCMHNRTMPTKFGMGCNPQNGATCSLTRPNGPNTQAFCGTLTPPVETCAPVGSSYLWNGVEWQDMGSPEWSMNLIGGNSSMPPSTYMDNPHAMGNGVYYYKSPPTMRCGLTGATPPEQCWQGGEVPVLLGQGNCETQTVPGFDGALFITERDCINTAQTRDNYHLNCMPGGSTPAEKARLMCVAVDVADTHNCGTAANIKTISDPPGDSCPAVAPAEGPMLPYGTIFNGVPVSGNASGFPSGQLAKYGGFGPADDGESARENINTGWCDAGAGPSTCVFHTMNYIHTCHNGVWDCNPSSSCAVVPTAVDGVCGAASGAPAAAAPTTGLCSNGTATAVAGAGPYTWSCNGQSGGANVSCATRAVIAGPSTCSWLWDPLPDSNGNGSGGCQPGSDTIMMGAGCSSEGETAIGCNAGIGWRATCRCSTTPVVLGQCGPANGKSYVDAAAIVAAGQCSAGTATVPQTNLDSNYHWAWTCMGDIADYGANYMNNNAGCGANLSPPTTTTTLPVACRPDGYQTGLWSGSEDALCILQSSFGPGLSTEPYAACCSGVHTPSYGPNDTVGGGDCNWKCGGGAAPPPSSGGTWRFAGSGCTDMFPDPGPYCSVLDEDKPCPTRGRRCRIPQGFGDGSCADGMMIHLQCR